VYRALDISLTDERIAGALRFIAGMELTEVAESCDASLTREARWRER
jgi:hypothetical protein